MSGVLHVPFMTLAGFTPVVDANTTFLLRCAAGNSFTDPAGGRTVSNVGSVTSSTTTVKFTGSASAEFTNTASKYLEVADAAALRPGSGDFCWEFWWYPTDLSSYHTTIAKGYVGAGDLLLQTGFGDGKIRVYTSGSVVLTSSTAVSTNAWTHVAVTRSGTSLRMFQNGSSVGTATNSTNLNSTATIRIGSDNGYPVIGFMQDVRFSIGAARYTTTFTPPDRLT